VYLAGISAAAGAVLDGEEGFSCAAEQLKKDMMKKRGAICLIKANTLFIIDLPVGKPPEKRSCNK